MRLTFPNGEHAAVELDGDELSIGSDRSNRVAVASVGLAPTHARLRLDRKGLWMRVGDPGHPVHVNARPVRALALLRAGDLLCLGHMQVQLCGDRPGEPVEPADEPTGDEAPVPTSACRVVLRGVAGSHFGRSVSLRAKRVLGTGEAADIRIDDPSLAGLTVELALHEDQVSLHVRRGEGVLVNGIACSRALLRHGDQVSVEQHRFVLEAPGLSRAATPAAVTDDAEPPAGTAGAEATPGDPSMTVWWLIAAAATLAAIITALLLYGPGAGS